MKYTVLLLRPDYMAGEFGKDTYMAHVEANDPEEALDLARFEALKVDGYAPEDHELRFDYHNLLLCKGYLRDLSHLAE